jgi:hypothetical protein
MAQTRRRRRKHRGTQSGSIDRRRASRPRSRQEARARARKQMGTKREGPPGWGTAVTRRLLGAGVFLLLLVLILRSPAPSVVLVLFHALICIPLRPPSIEFMFNRRQAAENGVSVSASSAASSGKAALPGAPLVDIRTRRPLTSRSVDVRATSPSAPSPRTATSPGARAPTAG